MDRPSPSIRDLARRLLAEEAARRAANDAHEADLVNEKLRISLTRLAGADSFTALNRRAQTLSQAEPRAPESIKDGAAVAYLLWLLVTFIGEALTLRLVRDTWPDIPFDE